MKVSKLRFSNEVASHRGSLSGFRNMKRLAVSLFLQRCEQRALALPNWRLFLIIAFKLDINQSFNLRNFKCLLHASKQIKPLNQSPYILKVSKLENCCFCCCCCCFFKIQKWPRFDKLFGKGFFFFQRGNPPRGKDSNMEQAQILNLTAKGDYLGVPLANFDP